MQPLIKRELQTLLEEDIIEEVASDPNGWISETVNVLKSNADEVRICVDMKNANTAIKDQDYPMPNVEEIIYNLNGMKVFTKIDLKAAFHQIELAPHSRHISRFRCLNRIYQYKRLFYGIHPASKIFNHILNTLLQDVPGVVNAIDDILVGGISDDNLNKTMEIVFKRLAVAGLTVNPNKCIFNVPEVTFYGLKFSSKGISLNDYKMEAIRLFKTPSNASVLHSFLGLSVYASRWINNLAELTAPLWNLIRSRVRWKWTPEHQQCFDQVKDSIIKSVGYYNLNWETSITVDASPVGISAVLTQQNPSNPDDKKIIICVSRKLSDTERRYSQIEREALAVVWGVERLNLYLLGKRFKIYVDNKAIQLIYKNPLSKPPARIQRWGLRLVPYQFEINHIPGRGNIADFLSSYPMNRQKDENEDEDDVESYIHSVIETLVPENVQREDILKATIEDPILQKLKQMIVKNKFDKRNIFKK